MSCRVMVVPEDPTYDHYILKPLIKRILEECGKATARVEVLTNPKANGYDHAKSILPEVFERYPHFDLFLFLPDADGNDRTNEFNQLENEASHSGVTLICVAAIQEIEVWLLAGHTTRIGIGWQAVREDTSVKENIFVPFLKNYGDARKPGGGRSELMNETIGNYRSLCRLCPEIANLQDRACAAVANCNE